MTPDATVLYSNESSYWQDSVYYTVKTYAYQTEDDVQNEESDIPDAIRIVNELTYIDSNNQKQTVYRHHCMVDKTDLEGVYQGLTNSTIGKFSTERIKLSATKQQLYRGLLEHNDFLISISQNPKHMRAFARNVINGDGSAIELINMMAACCVVELHERYGNNSNNNNSNMETTN